MASAATDLYNKYVIPCFNHVAIGDCPYGSKCIFVHDPNVRVRNGGYYDYDDTSSNSSGHTSHDSSSGTQVYRTTTRKKNQLKGMLKDFAFNFPFLPTVDPFTKGNDRVYKIPQPSRERDMWTHFTDSLAEQTTHNTEEKRPRLPVFSHIAEEFERVQMQVFRMKVVWINLVRWMPIEEKKRLFFVDGDWNYHKVQAWPFFQLVQDIRVDDDGQCRLFLQRVRLVNETYFESWATFWDAYSAVVSSYGII